MDGYWIRPVLPNKQQWKFLTYNNGEYIDIGDVIQINGKPRPDPPHTEDVEVQSFKRIRRMSHVELINFLTKNAENNVQLFHTLNRNNRSLCVVQAENFRKVYTEEDPRRTRIAFKLPDSNYEYINDTSKPGYPCVCLHWRAIQGKGLALPASFDRMFIAIGLARGFISASGQRIEPAPMIISVITNPKLPGDINYNDP